MALLWLYKNTTTSSRAGRWEETHPLHYGHSIACHGPWRRQKVSIGGIRRGWQVAVPGLGVGLVGEVVITGCVVVLGKGTVGVDVDGPSTRES